MVIPLFVGRAKSIKALELAMEADRRILLVAQKTAAKDEPEIADLFDIGCLATILQMLKLPDGTVKVLVEGQQRAVLTEVVEQECFQAHCQVIEVLADKKMASEVEALRRAVTQLFDQYVKLNKKIPSEILTSIASIDDAGPFGRHHYRPSAVQAGAQAGRFGAGRCARALGKSARTKLSARSKSSTWIKKSVAASSARWRRLSAIFT